MNSIEEAVDFIKSYDHTNGELEVLKYEIVVKYNNNDKVEGIFNTKSAAIEFLESYAAPKPKEN